MARAANNCRSWPGTGAGLFAAGVVGHARGRSRRWGAPDAPRSRGSRPSAVRPLRDPGVVVRALPARPRPPPCTAASRAALSKPAATEPGRAARRSPPSPERLERAREYAIAAARLCADLKCRDVRVLDVAGLSPVTDFFVLATAAGQRQMKTVARETAELGPQYDLKAMGRGHRDDPNDRWTAIDLVDVIVHVFSEEARLFYDLDNLWGDAREVLWARED